MSSPVRSIPRDELDEDRKLLIALQQLTDYNPSDPAYSLENLLAAETELTDAEDDDVRLDHAKAAGRDRRIRAGYVFHGLSQGAKRQLLAQYGPESNAIQAAGLKKRSEYKRPVRKKNAKTDKSTS